MEYVKFTVKVLALLFGLVVVFTYAALVYSGDLPKPNLQNIFDQVAPPLAVGGSTVATLAIALCCLVTAIAPFIFAARSGDLFTVIVTIVTLVVCFLLLFNSRTIVDMVLAAIVYFTSALVSVIVYSTNEIVQAIGKRRTAQAPQRPIADRPFN